MSFKPLFLLFSLSCLLSRCGGLSINYVGQFNVGSVAFLELGLFNESSPSVSLLASGFGVFSGDALYYVPTLKPLSSVNGTQPITLTTSITWPNEPCFVPSGTVRGYTEVVGVGGGFLVPGQSTGAVTVLNLAGSSAPVELSPSKSGYFYHRLRWMDVNHDGLADVMTARATKPLFGSGSGELVWLQQPSGVDPLAAVPWTATHLVDGPDFLFELIDVDGDGVYEVAAAEYFGMRLSLTYTTTGNWADPTSIRQTVIDSQIKSGFDVHVLDVNGDGLEELVATNHEGDGTGAVYAYEVPHGSDWRSGNWTRHVLASGFPVTEPGLNQASPGAPIPFYPQTSQTSGRRWIILAGDGSQAAYELRPASATGWDYTITTIINAGATIGMPAVADIDGDGYVEALIPAYDTGIVYVYTYAPTYH